nr:hypothetical protein [Tanacetum cinerariifolium]
MPLLAPMLVVPAAGDGADAVPAGAAAAHDGALTCEEAHACEGAHLREEVGPTTFTRPPSPTRHTSVHEDISEGGGDFVSSPQSNEAPQTPAATAAEAWPSDIIATIDANEVVVTESLIRTQLQLNDVNGLYEFTLHDVLDGMRAIGYPTDGSLTFYKAKLSPQWIFLIYTLIHFAVGAAVANEVPPPPPLTMTPPPDVLPIHTSFSTPGPSTATQDTPVRDPTPTREPILVREPT